jgi:molybdopterin molybdotransferase
MMLSVKEARHRLLAALPLLPPEPVPIGHAAGRVLAGDMHAPFDLPSFSNSSMDGFALRAEDIQGASEENGVRLQVVADIPAGISPDRPIEPGESARIMTGAKLPSGADTVVPVEQTDFSARGPGLPAPETVEIFRSQQSWDYIRRKGEDVATGDLLLAAGTRLRPQDVGMLAMLGFANVDVHRRAKVALLSTGDELQVPGAELAPGQIYESNSPTLAALVEAFGGQVVPLGIAPDDAHEVERRLDQAVEFGADLIISSAGVSVGAFDYVKDVVEEKGGLDFWRVNMRPGKPLAFGDYRGLPFIGLPGNPVSAFVGFQVFVRFGLAKMMGMQDWQPIRRKGVLGEPIRSDGRESYLRTRLQQTDPPTVYLTGHQGSGNQFSLVQADALFIVPAGVLEMKAGDVVEIWPV